METSSSSIQRYPHYFSIVVLGVSTFLLLWFVYQKTPLADADQWKFISYSFRDGLPSAEIAVTSQVLVGLVNLLVPFNLVTTSAILRIIGAGLFLGVGVLLSTQVRWSALFFALLLTSSYPFLWVSMDLFVSAYFMFFVWSLLTKRPFAVTAIALALFALARPDMLVPGVLLSVYLIYRQPKRFAPALVMIALIGIPYLLTSRQSDGVSERAWLSLCQHYSVLVAPAGASGEFNPWTNCPRYFEPVFGATHKLTEIIFGNLAAYIQFIEMSLQRSWQNLAATNLLPIVLILLATLRLRTPKTRMIAIITGLLLSNLLSVIALSFLQFRYMVRFYPIILLFLFSSLDTWQNRPFERFAVRLVQLLFLLILVIQILHTLYVLPSGVWGD
jgi:hypothetical protein